MLIFTIPLQEMIADGNMWELIGMLVDMLRPLMVGLVAVQHRAANLAGVARTYLQVRGPPMDISSST
jgi:hypothetical protein